MPFPYSITDFIFNRKKTIPFSEGPFRTVPGRIMFSGAGIREYRMSQSSFPLIVANAEYTIRGIATLATINLKAREGRIQVSLYEGQSGITFSRLEDGQSMDVTVLPGMINSPMNLYVQSPIAGAILEILGLSLL